MTTSPRRIEHMPLDDIPGAERNPKKHDIPKIRGSLLKYGCTIGGIIDERTGRLVAGHGRRLALQQMKAEGEDAPEGILVEDGTWKVPLLRGWASANDAEAEAYLVTDNRLNELGGWEERVLAEVLDDVAAYNISLVEIAGYDHLELDDLLAAFGEDVEVMPPQPTAARYAESDEEIERRRAAIESYGDRKAGGSLTEMILVFTSDEHAEAVSLIRAIRARDGEQTAAQVVLGVLRACAPEEATAE